MRSRFIPSLLLIGLLSAPMAVAQEVLPDEDRDTIEPKKKDAAAGPQTEATEEHTVSSGDTLWDLCGRYLNNPWYWPRVWSYNPEITNPHWIFPGQVVRFYPGGEGPGQLDLVSRKDFEVPEPEDMDDLDDEMLPPDDLVSMTGNYVQAQRTSAFSLLRNAFVTPEELEYMGTIRASQEEVQFLSELNKVYVDFKNLSEVQAGQQYAIYRTDQEITHPITGDFIGYATDVIGSLRIEAIAETSAVATIVGSHKVVVRGDRVGPIMEKMTQPVAPVANGVELKGYIVGAAVSQLQELGERHLVFIDQGTKQGVQEGNLFEVIRREDSLFLPGEGKEEGKWDKSMPAEIYGRIMVVDARESTSTGVVVSSLRELRIGDRVLMSVR